jgi:hypothetical protein
MPETEKLIGGTEKYLNSDIRFKYPFTIIQPFQIFQII